MEKITESWGKSFYGADVEAYKPRIQGFIEKKSLEPKPSVATTLPMKLLPLRGDSLWIECFHPEEEKSVKEFVPSLETGSNYVPPSWSNVFIGTAAAEQQTLNELAHIGAAQTDTEMDTFIMVKGEALEKKMERRFAVLPVSIVKQEPSIAIKKEIHLYDPAAIERELPILLVAKPLAKSSKPSMPLLDNIDDDFCNVNDLLPLEAIETFLKKEPASPTSSVGQENHPELGDRKLKDVLNKIKASYKPLKRAIETEPQAMPAKKARKNAPKEKGAKQRIADRRNNKKQLVKQYSTRKENNDLVKGITKAKKECMERQNHKRAEVRKKKPSYNGDSGLTAHPPTAEKKEEEAPQLHLR